MFKGIFDDYKKIKYIELQEKKAFSNVSSLPLKERLFLQKFLVEQFSLKSGLSLSPDDLSLILYDELAMSTPEELQNLPFSLLKDLSLNEEQIEIVAPLISAHYKDSRYWNELSKLGHSWADIAEIINKGVPKIDQHSRDKIRKGVQSIQKLLKNGEAEAVLRELADKIAPRLMSLKR